MIGNDPTDWYIFCHSYADYAENYRDENGEIGGKVIQIYHYGNL